MNELMSMLDRKETTLGNRLWRLTHLYKIRTKDRKVIQFRFNGIQQRIWQSIAPCMDENAGWKIIKPFREYDLKYRQGGVSTFWELFWLDDTVWHANTTTGIQAHKREALGYLWQIVRFAYLNMPEDIRPPSGDDSKTALSFPDRNSQIFVSLSIRSTALQNLHVSEFAICKDEEIQASMGACAPTSNITLETTGNGVGNMGYEIYQESKRNESDYRANFFPWFLQTEYFIPLNEIDPSTIILTKDERKLADLMEKDYSMILTPEQILWRRAKRRELKWLFQQEFPETDEDAFLTSGHKFFEPRKIHRLMKAAKLNKTAIVDPNGDYIQWETPQPKDIYVAGADTAEGSHDYSYLKIINVSKRREAFMFRARCGVDYFYKVLDKWCRYFRNAFLAVERNNHGHAVILGLEEICHYPHLYKEEKPQPVIGIASHPMKTGWITDKNSKPLMLDELKYAIEGDWDQDEDHFAPQFQVFDLNFLQECLTFEQLDGKLEAIEGKFDDGVIATAIAWQMFKRQRRYVTSDREPKGNIPGILTGPARETAGGNL